MRLGISTWVWTSPATTAVLETLLPHIAALGFDVIELPIEEVGQFDVARVGELARAHGLEVSVCAVIGAGRDLLLPGEAERGVRVPPVVHRGGAAARLLDGGGPVLFRGRALLALHARPSASATSTRSPRTLRSLGEYAADHGVVLGVETLNRFETSFLNTTAQALELIGRIDHPAVGVALDLFHLGIEEKHVGDALRAAGPHLVHVQVAENDRGHPGHRIPPWHDVADGPARDRLSRPHRDRDVLGPGRGDRAGGCHLAPARTGLGFARARRARVPADAPRRDPRTPYTKHVPFAPADEPTLGSPLDLTPRGSPMAASVASIRTARRRWRESTATDCSSPRAARSPYPPSHLPSIGDILRTLKSQFVLSNQEVGYIGGAAIWGFAVSILLLGPLCDVLGHALPHAHGDGLPRPRRDHHDHRDRVLGTVRRSTHPLTRQRVDRGGVQSARRDTVSRRDKIAPAQPVPRVVAGRDRARRAGQLWPSRDRKQRRGSCASDSS